MLILYLFTSHNNPIQKQIYILLMDEKLGNPPPSNRDQPLITIPEANAAIYSQYLVVFLYEPMTADTGEEITIPTLMSETDHTRNKIIINFNNSELAFNVLEENSIVEIHNIAKQTIQCQLQVKKIGTLFTIQSLLRKKMCEMGFERRYVRMKKLGSGATAEVFLVSRKSDGKQFAAKIISIKQSSQKSYETFINEAKLLRVLQHKNIVCLESLYIEKKMLVEVLEYLEGGTLLSFLKQGSFQNLHQKWLAIKDLTEALEHLRQKRILHRDLKLENIMIRKGTLRNEFVLTDFGLAAWGGEAKPLFERCGTPGYIAPEVLSAEKGHPVLDHRIDIFSLGVIAHLMFLFQPLFQYTGNVKQLLRLNKKAEFSLSESRYEVLSSDEFLFLDMCLKKDTTERATANILLATLQSFVFETPKKAKDKEKSKEKQFKEEMKELGVDVKIKKSTSMTKKNICIDIPEKKSCSNEKRSESKSSRGVISSLWNSLITPTKQKNRGMKIKENSLQKHNKLKDFFA